MAFRATLLRRWLLAVRRAETLESERNFHGGSLAHAPTKFSLGPKIRLRIRIVAWSSSIVARLWYKNRHFSDALTRPHPSSNKTQLVGSKESLRLRKRTLTSANLPTNTLSTSIEITLLGACFLCHTLLDLLPTL